MADEKKQGKGASASDRAVSVDELEDRIKTRLDEEVDRLMAMVLENEEEIRGLTMAFDSLRGSVSWLKGRVSGGKPDSEGAGERTEEEAAEEQARWERERREQGRVLETK